MKEIFIEKDNLPEAYHAALVALDEYGEICNCSDWNTTQKEVSMTFTVNYPLSEPLISRCFIGGPAELEQYRQEMLYGILDFEIAQGKWTYTYHDRIDNYEIVPGLGVSQIKFVVEELERNPQSRRAVIDIRLNKDDMYSDDPACLQHIQYFIRNNKLDCKVLFRSNDACKATFMNAYALIQLQKLIADKLNIEIGTYTHRANSFHCYEKDFEMLNGYVKRIKSQELEDITYEFSGFWEVEMMAAGFNLKDKIQELKDR